MLNEELSIELNEYKSKCEMKKECPARLNLDGCAWCYVEHLKDINLRAYIERQVTKRYDGFKTAKDLYNGGLNASI